MHKQLTGIFKDSIGRTLTQYLISDICGCVTKFVNPYEKYELAQSPQFDLSFTEEDKFVFKEFLSFPKIEEYCSKSLLDSGKGFIKIRKKN